MAMPFILDLLILLLVIARAIALKKAKPISLFNCPKSESDVLFEKIRFDIFAFKVAGNLYE